MCLTNNRVGGNGITTLNICSSRGHETTQSWSHAAGDGSETIPVPIFSVLPGDSRCPHSHGLVERGNDFNKSTESYQNV